MTTSGLMEVFWFTLILSNCVNGLFLPSSEDDTSAESNEDFDVRNQLPTDVYETVPLEGWEKGKNLHVADYVMPRKKTVVYSGRKTCPQDPYPDAVVVVCSAVQHFDLRMAIRNSYAIRDSYSKHKITVTFLLGQSHNPVYNKRAIDENRKYEDIVVEDLHDTYRNLTLKSLRMMKWAIHKCSGVKFLLKADDDTFVNVQNLANYVAALKNLHESSKFLIGGNIWNGALVKRDPREKDYAPIYMYPDKRYPPFISGVTYMLSMSTARSIYQASLSMKMFHLEDVFITGMCTKKLQIPIQQNSALFGLPKPKQCNQYYTTAITMGHHLVADDMLKIHKITSNCKPSKEYLMSLHQHESKIAKISLSIKANTDQRGKTFVHKIKNRADFKHIVVVV